MKFAYSESFLKQYRRFPPQFRRIIDRKLILFAANRFHPSLRYKPIRALKDEDPPVKEISISPAATQKRPVVATSKPATWIA